MANFNSRPCERGDLAYEADELGVGAFQFSPLREGRRAGALPLNISRDISILAPARGATPGGDYERFDYPISILAPARGATFLSPRDQGHGQFQFSPLREGRPGL